MKYIAIYQTNKDVPTTDPVLSQLPDAYPITCEEFDSPDAAAAKYPNSTIMTTEAYAGYQAAFKAQYDEEVAAQANPSFWSNLNPFK